MSVLTDPCSVFNGGLLQSVVICDIILLYCTKRRGFYADQKYLMVKDEDAFLVSDVVTQFICQGLSRPSG